MTPARQITELTRDEALQLVGSVPVGRIVFTSRALPAIRPVSHLLAGDQIIIRASLGAAIGSASRDGGTVVAYQADMALAARYRKSLRPWMDEEMDEMIAIDADLVTGFRMVPASAGEPVVGATAVPEISAV
jgi:Pyridoxamine 5'-phosphate oxidase